MKISEKEHDLLVSVAKTKEGLLELKANLVAEVESHEAAGDASTNSNENTLNHRTKIRKETLNWSQHSEIILLFLRPFFGRKNASLVCCICGLKKEN